MFLAVGKDKMTGSAYKEEEMTGKVDITKRSWGKGMTIIKRKTKA